MARELLGGQTSQVEETGGEVIKAYLREVELGAEVVALGEEMAPA